MNKYEILSKEHHRQVRIKTGHSAALGDAAMYVMTYPMEFRDIQSCYPILFTKDPNTGGFLAAAVLGFEADQNLFLQDDRWDAAYIPAMIKRQPFLIATGASYRALWDRDKAGGEAKAKATRHFGQEEAKRSFRLLPPSSSKRNPGAVKSKQILQDLFVGDELRAAKQFLQLNPDSSFTKVVVALYYSDRREQFVAAEMPRTRKRKL